MNYYIQGNKEKAEEIKAAFKKLGYDVTGFDMCNDNILFFTHELEGGCKVLSTTNANLYTANLIKTHPDYKELPLPVEPKFKDGDKVVFGTLHETIAMVLRNEQRYLCESCREILFKEQDRWHLAPKPHYDIKNFHAGMPVLVRDENVRKWCYALYSHYDSEVQYPFITAGDNVFIQCIPFEGNEHLLGTTDMCPEEYINW